MIRFHPALSHSWVGQTQSLRMPSFPSSRKSLILGWGDTFFLQGRQNSYQGLAHLFKSGLIIREAHSLMYAAIVRPEFRSSQCCSESPFSLVLTEPIPTSCENKWEKEHQAIQLIQDTTNYSF